MESRKDITLIKSDFIEEVIRLAKIPFISGNANNENLNKQLLNDPDLAQSFHHNRRYLSIKDPSIPDEHDATRIPGTNFIASAGPKCNTMEMFIRNTVYHPQTPVHTVVALGNVTAYDDYSYQDFFDYCLKERELKCGSYGVSINRLRGEISSTVSGKQTYPDTDVHSRLTIADKTLDVFVFELSDNTPINLTPHPKNNKKELYERKERMCQLFQKSLQEPILVHCASGVGRTGHFILTMDILKNYDSIFANSDPKRCAQMIHQLLENMRQVRPALVNSPEQFSAAIRNAHHLYTYMLEKKNISEPSFFKPKGKSQTLENSESNHCICM